MTGGRLGALGLLTALVFGWLVLAGGGDEYTVTAHFSNASQLVGSEEVVLGGVSVGRVREIDLGADGQAKVTFAIYDDYVPLQRGTVATVRSFSLAGVANRQVQLTPPAPGTGGDPIPDGGEMGQDETVSEVDLDEVFNTLDDKTVGDFKNVVRGFERSYDGIESEANEGLRYANPLLSTSRRVIAELIRDDRAFESLLVDTAKLSGALAERAPDITDLVANANATFGAIASEQVALRDAIALLPGFMREFNTTAVNLRSALDDLDPLVEASLPAARRLRPFLAELRGASARLVPTIRDLDAIIRRPGELNDLVELTLAQVPLNRIAAGPVRRNGAEREGALPAAAASLRDSLATVAYLRPYTPELLAWMDDFGHSGVIDANGGIGRIQANLNTYSLSPNGLPLLSDIQLGLAQTPAQQIGALSVGNRNRCPGTLERDPGDGSIPFTDDGALDCDTTQLAVGP